MYANIYLKKIPRLISVYDTVCDDLLIVFSVYIVVYSAFALIYLPVSKLPLLANNAVCVMMTGCD